MFTYFFYFEYDLQGLKRSVLWLQIRFCMSFTYWTSPVVLSVLYRRGYFSTEGLISIGKFVFSISVIYSVAYITRGNSVCYSTMFKLFYLYISR